MKTEKETFTEDTFKKDAKKFEKKHGKKVMYIVDGVKYYEKSKYFHKNIKK